MKEKLRETIDQYGLEGCEMDIIKTNLIIDTWKLLLERDYGMFENMSDVLH